MLLVSGNAEFFVQSRRKVDLTRPERISGDHLEPSIHVGTHHVDLAFVTHENQPSGLSPNSIAATLCATNFLFILRVRLSLGGRRPSLDPVGCLGEANGHI